MANFTYQIRKLLPSPILAILSVAKRTLWQAIYAREDIEFKDDHPYTSPNIWQRVEKFYLNLPHPVVFEFGMGVSSLYHIRNLIKHGSGVFIGVEHKREWYTNVINAVVSHCIESGLAISASMKCKSSKVQDGIQLYDSEFLMPRRVLSSSHHRRRGIQSERYFCKRKTDKLQHTKGNFDNESLRKSLASSAQATSI